MPGLLPYSVPTLCSELPVVLLVLPLYLIRSALLCSQTFPYFLLLKTQLYPAVLFLKKHTHKIPIEIWWWPLCPYKKSLLGGLHLLGWDRQQQGKVATPLAFAGWIIDNFSHQTKHIGKGPSTSYMGLWSHVVQVRLHIAPLAVREILMDFKSVHIKLKILHKKIHMIILHLRSLQTVM